MGKILAGLANLTLMAGIGAALLQLALLVAGRPFELEWRESVALAGFVIVVRVVDVAMVGAVRQAQKSADLREDRRSFWAEAQRSGRWSSPR